MYEKIIKGLAGVALFTGAVYIKVYIAGVCHENGEEAKRRWKREDAEWALAARKAAEAASRKAAEAASEEEEKENE